MQMEIVLHFFVTSDNIDELEHSVQENLPRVSVIMPLKGFGEHKLKIGELRYDQLHYIYIMIAVYVLDSYVPYALIIHESTDYSTLWGTTGIPVCRRERRRSGLSCCFPFDRRVQGKWIASKVCSHGILKLFIYCNLI